MPKEQRGFRTEEQQRDKNVGRWHKCGGVGGNAGRTCRISSLQRRQRDRYSVLQRGELKGGSYATPGGSDGKVPAYNAGTLGLTPGGWEDPLEKDTATHPSTLAWRLPRTEDPGGLQFMGSQRVRHD